MDCHGGPKGELDVTGFEKEGLRIGDIGGAVSITAPAELYQAGIDLNTGRTAVFFVLFLSVAFGASVLFFRRNVTAPIARIEDATVEVGRGNLEVDLKGMGHSRELNDLATGVEAMARELREHKSSFIVFSILRILVLVVLVRQIMLANYEGAFFCILTLLLLYVPSWIQVKLRIELPPPLEITIFCFIFAAEILGEVNAFYVVIPGWDTMLHTINGFLAAAVGFSMVMLLNDDDRITFHLSPAFLALVAFCFSMTIGVLWEFFEFGMDFFLGTDMQKDTVIHAIHSVSLDPTLSNKVVTIPDIQDVVINGESLGLGGYLDIGIIDTMKDLFVNFIGAVVFSLSGFFFARSKGRRKSAAQGFVPSKKTAEQDYLQQALEEADQKDADAPTPDGPPAPGEPEGA